MQWSSRKNHSDCKIIFRKALANSKDPYLALLFNRVTPVLESVYSSAELLINRKLSTVLPSSEDYSTGDVLPESTPVVKSQDQVIETASDFQFNPESNSHDPTSRGPDQNQIRQSCETT
ncbi:hypothetical protein AVEN_205876-1 [Araneus ventricosus]|uniref:Uncharacterized protein n=1 Tax=Araneus ventricosus TaxID=182803 RepID=A0A4Y2IUA9_ARAVE|nr:hypothetical protein AVEN_205876-1 [Araneus ventricosus]